MLTSELSLRLPVSFQLDLKKRVETDTEIRVNTKIFINRHQIPTEAYSFWFTAFPKSYIELTRFSYKENFPHSAKIYRIIYYDESKIIVENGYSQFQLSIVQHPKYFTVSKIQRLLLSSDVSTGFANEHETQPDEVLDEKTQDYFKELENESSDPMY